VAPRSPLLLRRPRRPTLFPYTTLFRSLPPQHGPDLPVPLREERALLEHCSDLLQELSIGVSGLRASLLEHAPLLRRPATTHRRRGIDTRAGRAKDRADHGERVAPIRRRAHHPSDLLSFLRDRKSTRLNSSHVKISYAV